MIIRPEIFCAPSKVLKFSPAGMFTSPTHHETPIQADRKERQEPTSFNSMVGLNYALRQIQFPSLLVFFN